MSSSPGLAADLNEDTQVFYPHLWTDIYMERSTNVPSICCHLRSILIIVMLQKVSTGLYVSMPHSAQLSLITPGSLTASTPQLTLLEFGAA